MRISFSIEITRDSEPEPEPEVTIQPDMSGVHIEVSAADIGRELEMATRRVGFGTH